MTMTATTTTGGGADDVVYFGPPRGNAYITTLTSEEDALEAVELLFHSLKEHQQEHDDSSSSYYYYPPYYIVLVAASNTTNTAQTTALLKERRIICNNRYVVAVRDDVSMLDTCRSLQEYAKVIYLSPRLVALASIQSLFQLPMKHNEVLKVNNNRDDLVVIVPSSSSSSSSSSSVVVKPLPLRYNVHYEDVEAGTISIADICMLQCYQCPKYHKFWSRKYARLNSEKMNSKNGDEKARQRPQKEKMITSRFKDLRLLGCDAKEAMIIAQSDHGDDHDGTTTEVDPSRQVASMFGLI